MESYFSNGEIYEHCINIANNKKWGVYNKKGNQLHFKNEVEFSVFNPYNCILTQIKSFSNITFYNSLKALAIEDTNAKHSFGQEISWEQLTECQLG